MQPVFDIPEIYYQHGIKRVIISPGSRSAPLTIAFARHPKIEKFIIPDERSAAFYALGMSQVDHVPTILICTSGTASINYFPAIAEAFLRKIPLIVLTADRPPEHIQQQEGQAIFQHQVYGQHVVKSYQLPFEYSEDSSIYFNRIINESALIANEYQQPVHLNIPFREPFYPSQDDKFSTTCRIVTPIDLPTQLDISKLNHLIQGYQKILIIAGQHEPLETISINGYIPVFQDITCNYQFGNLKIEHIDYIIGDTFEHPDLIIQIGEAFISKSIKQYLRKNTQADHWLIRHETTHLTDTFYGITNVIQASAKDILPFLDFSNVSPSYFNACQQIEEKISTTIAQHLSSLGESELKAVNQVLNTIPHDSIVHLGNSMPVRYAHILRNKTHTQQYFCNRGASGIDGSSSTAIGTALVTQQMNVVILGDMSFLYDHNAFWNQHIPENLLFIVINNQGGGIFKLINGPSSQPEMTDYFVTPQQQTAQSTATSHGFHYISLSSSSNISVEIEKVVKKKQKTIIEFHIESDENKKSFQSLRALLAKL